MNVITQFVKKNKILVIGVAVVATVGGVWLLTKKKPKTRKTLSGVRKRKYLKK